MSRRGSVPFLLAAGAVIVAVVGVVLVFGVARPPALPALNEATGPQPPGGVAWSTWEDGERCLQVARPDGTVERLDCVRQDGGAGDVRAWTDEGIVVSAWTPGGEEEVVVYDPRTGEELERRIVEDEPTPTSRVGDTHSAVRTRYEGGELIVTLADDPDTIVWRVEAPERYEVRHATRSPDGDWLAFTDSAGRLLVVALVDDAPRVWSDDVDAWQQVVWEATPAPER